MGKWLRNKLGVSALQVESRHRLDFLSALLQFSTPEVIIPEPSSLRYAQKRIRREYAIEDFNPAIHKNDLMFQHHLRKLPHAIPEALFHYYNVGLQGLQGLANRLEDPREVRSLLDFGSGYGRGSRFVPYIFPQAQVSVSEIKPLALRFQEVQFGFQTISHSADPASFSHQPFELILAISVFSHLPRHDFQRWLKVLVDHLEEKGHLFFTYNPIVEADTDRGYYFVEQSEDKGLNWVPDRIDNSDQYGSAFYSDRAMLQILEETRAAYHHIIPRFSGNQNLVHIKK